MPTPVNGEVYYSTQETAIAAGISKPTLLRWIKSNRIKDSAKRNRNGWRLFAEAEVAAIRKLALTAK